MKLGIIGTGKIIHDALYAMEPLEQIKKNAIFARLHSRDKGEGFSGDMESAKYIRTTMNCSTMRMSIPFTSAW